MNLVMSSGPFSLPPAIALDSVSTTIIAISPDLAVISFINSDNAGKSTSALNRSIGDGLTYNGASETPLFFLSA